MTAPCSSGAGSLTPQPSPRITQDWVPAMPPLPPTRPGQPAALSKTNSSYAVLLSFFLFPSVRLPHELNFQPAFCVDLQHNGAANPKTLLSELMSGISSLPKSPQGKQRHMEHGLQLTPGRKMHHVPKLPTMALRGRTLHTNHSATKWALSPTEKIRVFWIST